MRRLCGFNEAAALLPRKLGTDGNRLRIRNGFNEAAALLPRKREWIPLYWTPTFQLQ